MRASLSTSDLFASGSSDHIHNIAQPSHKPDTTALGLLPLRRTTMAGVAVWRVARPAAVAGARSPHAATATAPRTPQPRHSGDPRDLQTLAHDRSRWVAFSHGWFRVCCRRKIRASSFRSGGEDWVDIFRIYDKDESGTATKPKPEPKVTRRRTNTPSWKSPASSFEFELRHRLKTLPPCETQMRRRLKHKCAAV